MTNREIDDLIKSAPPKVDPALLADIERSMRETLAPVRPLPPSWMLTAGLTSLCGIIAAASAGLLGFKGIRRLSFEQIGLIFSVLALFTILVASLTVAEVIPGSRRIAHTRTLLAAVVLAILASFSIAFSRLRHVPIRSARRRLPGGGIARRHPHCPGDLGGAASGFHGQCDFRGARRRNARRIGRRHHA